MPIKVQCACGKAFAAKDELAGKTVKCPGCQKPLKIPGGTAAPTAAAPKPAAKPAAAKPAPAKSAVAKPSTAKPSTAKQQAAARPADTPEPRDGAQMFDEIGLQAAAEGTHPCPGCTEPMPIQAVVCIKCGYNTRIGRRMETMKVGGESDGPVGHGAVATDLLDKAARIIDEDVAEEKKKTKEGLPWWAYLIVLLALVGFAIWMLLNWGVEKPGEGDKKSSLPSEEITAVA
jgi:hypothetical protein